MSNKDISTIVANFVAAAIACFDCQLKHDHKGMRKEGEKLKEYYCQLRNYGDEGIAALKALNTHEHLGVRVSAASKLMWVDQHYAMTTLRSLSTGWSEKYPLGSMERDAACAGETVFALLYTRGAPLSPDPYIAWKEAKEKKASTKP